MNIYIGYVKISPMALQNHIETGQNGSSPDTTVNLVRRARAIRHSHRVAGLLLQDGDQMPLVMQLYRHGIPQTQIVREVPLTAQVAEVSSEVAARAIGHALQQELDPLERAEIARTNRQRAQRENVVALRTRQVSRSPELQGKKIRWKLEEKIRLYEMLQDPVFMHEEGSKWTGKPNYDLIAQALNAQFYPSQDAHWDATHVSQKVNDDLFAAKRRAKRLAQRASNS